MLTHGNIISNTAAFLKTTEVNIVAIFGICVWIYVYSVPSLSWLRDQNSLIKLESLGQ